MAKKLINPESYLPSEIIMQLAKIIDTQHKLKSKPSKAVFILFNGLDLTTQEASLQFLCSMLDLKIKYVDLSKTFSKYIGETEKNLEKLIAHADKSNMILFFDEADALFGKRTEVTDAHDKYANQEISYIIQQLEKYVGIIIIATHKKVKPLSAIKKRFHLIS